MQLFIVCCATAVFAAVAVADTLPASNGGFGNGFARQVEDDSLTGPYAPSGWQPDGPQLQLPTREYGAPADVGGGSVEVSEQTVLFAGQSVSTELVPATATVSSRYLPATSDAVVAGQEPNVLRVQGLPLAPAAPFNGQLNRGEIRVRPTFQQYQQQQQQLKIQQQQRYQQQIRVQQQQRLQQQQQQQQPRIVFRPVAAQAIVPQTLVPTQQRLTVPAAQVAAPFHKHHKKPHLVPQQQQQQFGQLQQFSQQQQQIQFAQNQNQFAQGQQTIQFAQKQEQQPAQAYGPPDEPQVVYGPPATAATPDQQYGPPQTRQPKQPEAADANADDDEDEDDDDSEPEQFTNETETEQNSGAIGGPAVSVANAFANNNGQYYILGEDNRLQRVVYMTRQTAKDREQNGFSARLQYAPVEPIRDPIYAYDAAGQLVRIYNRK